MKREKKLQNQLWKERMPLIASFFLPFFILTVICILHDVYPFGEQCILHIDMYHQYCPFFTELMDKIKHGGSMFYSWNIGLGADFISLYAYYLASPLNWLLLLCPQNHVIEFMTLLVILKISLAGLFFGYYLKEHFEKNHAAISIFATAYALCGFSAAYAWDIMWLDCMMLAPLVVLGLEQLIKEKKVLLYYISLSLCIISNYYIAIMVCIFQVIWFVITWLENKETGIGAWIRFALYSLLAGGTGAILIIPEAITLGASGSQNISFPDTMEWYFNIIAELGRHSVMTEPYTGKDHWPNIYCGVFVLLLFVLYLFNREISWKKKLSRGLLAAFFVISFSNNILDFIWHGMHFPDSLPGRQTFLYAFLMLAVSYEAFLHFKGTRFLDVIAAGVASVGLMAVSYHFSDGTILGESAATATYVFLGSYIVVLLIYFYAEECIREDVVKKIGKIKKATREELKKIMLSFGCAAMLLELFFNYNVTGFDTTSRTAYVKSMDDYHAVLAEAENQAQDKGILFYRTEELERKTKNDAALYGYRSATQFSSLMNINVSHIYQDLGMEGGKNFYCINGASPLISSMLSLKYVIADNAMEESPLRTLVASSGNTYLYENKYSLPLGFMVDGEVAERWDYKNGGGVSNQNELAGLLGAQEEMLTVVPSESETGMSAIQVTEDGYYFAAYSSVTSDTLEEEVSDGRTKSFTKASHGYILDLGYVKAGEVIRIKNSNNERVDITAYQLNMDALDTAYETLNSQTMELTSFSDRKITGTIDVEKAGNLVFSIAREDGWTVYVDGKETEPETFAEAFISVPLTDGKHDIELIYTTPGLKTGAMISLGCLMLFLLSAFWRGKQEKNIVVSESLC